jgi:hypothetical protein
MAKKTADGVDKRNGTFRVKGLRVDVPHSPAKGAIWSLGIGIQRFQMPNR